MLQPTETKPGDSYEFFQPSTPIEPESLKKYSADLKYDDIDTVIMGPLDDTETVHEDEVIVE
jgi:hypothetical protein